MSVKIIAEVYELSQATGGARLVLLALADFADDAGVCWPSVRAIAAKARLSQRQAIRHLRTLEELGELAIETPGGGRFANRYRVSIRANRASQDADDTPVVDVTPPLSSMTPHPCHGRQPNRHRTVNTKKISPTVDLLAQPTVTVTEISPAERRRRNQVVDEFLSRLEKRYPILGFPSERRVWASIGHKLTRIDPHRAEAIADALFAMAAKFRASQAPPAMLVVEANRLMRGAS